MRRRWLAAAAGGLGAAAVALSACPTEEKVPGELLGAFQFEVALAQDGCGYQQPESLDPLSEWARVGDPAPFGASLSFDPATGAFYLTSGATQLEGTLADGGRAFEVHGEARRKLPAPCNCNGTITERIEGAMYGEAQAAAGGCKAPVVEGGGSFVADGGVPVKLVCGFLIDEMLADDPDAGCSCAPCLVVYEIAGARQ